MYIRTKASYNYTLHLRVYAIQEVDKYMCAGTHGTCRFFVQPSLICTAAHLFQDVNTTVYFLFNFQQCLCNINEPSE